MTITSTYQNEKAAPTTKHSKLALRLTPNVTMLILLQTVMLHLLGVF